MPGKREKVKGGVKAKDINFMVVRGTGKVRRFRISSRLLIFSFLFFMTYVVVSLFAVNGYLTLRLRVAEQEKKLRCLKSKLTEVSHKLYEANQRIALMQHAVVIKPAETVQKEAAKEVQRKVANKQDARVEDKPTPVAGGASSNEAPEVLNKAPAPSPVVGIKDLKVKVTPASLNLAFKVYNVSEDPGPIRGYVHMIWLQDRSDMSKAWSYPNIKLVDAMPLDYKTGRLFSIRRFRKIRASFERKANMAIPSTLRIIVFDKSGKEVLLRDYDMGKLTQGKGLQLSEASLQ